MNKERLQHGDCCTVVWSAGYRRRPRLGAIAMALSITLTGLAGAVLPMTTSAQSAQKTLQSFSISAGSLRGAVDMLASQSGITVMYSPELVAGKTTRGLSGRFTSAQALQRLLQGSGLEAQDAGDSTYTLRQASAPEPKPQAEPRNMPAPATSAEPGIQDLGKMTVTGTRIRGGTTPSPVITIGSERIQEEGFTDLGQVIRSIPQNFRGGQNPGVVNGAVSSLSNQNLTGGSGLNLRGLGPDATLTLLNGRRMSYGGFAQAVDISAIPVEAVERLEIVPDGASAIYGSDAVGGVGNVILKRDFDGMTVGARYGGATDGGLRTREYTATAGYQWSTGGFIATYKDASNEPIYADQRGYTENMYEPYTIYSGNDLRSGLLSVHQSLDDIVELRLDALRTKRDRAAYEGYSGFYASSAPETISSLVSPTIEVSLPNDWTLSIGGSWGKDETNNYGSIVAPTGISSSGSFYGNKSRVYEMDAEGSLFSLPGGDARLAVGAGYRTNDFLQRNLISGNIGANGEESSRFAYAEVDLPLIGPDENVAGVRRLALTGAVRGEDYDSFGSVITPKLGVIYGPSADFTLKASWGKSFKAPTLLQQGQTRSAYLYTANNFGGTGYAADATVLMPYGGNPDLNPERAKTWSASLAFHPGALPNLETELTWFNIDYTNRVVQPIPNLYQALSNQVYAEFVDYYPTPAKLADILATASTFYNNAGVAYDATKVVAIVNDLYTNAARQRIKGLDLSGSYRFDLGSGRLTVRGSASWLDSKQKLTSAQAAYDLAGTLFNPAKVNGRVGAVWNQGNFSASTFVNYVDGVTNTLDGLKSASFTSFDTTLRYGTGERNDALSALVFELSVQNLFDRTPPLYTPTSVTDLRYDSTNYSAVGRYLSVAVSKHW